MKLEESYDTNGRSLDFSQAQISTNGTFIGENLEGAASAAAVHHTSSLNTLSQGPSNQQSSHHSPFGYQSSPSPNSQGCKSLQEYQPHQSEESKFHPVHPLPPAASSQLLPALSAFMLYDWPDLSAVTEETTRMRELSTSAKRSSTTQVISPTKPSWVEFHGCPSTFNCNSLAILNFWLNGCVSDGILTLVCAGVELISGATWLWGILRNKQRKGWKFSQNYL